MKTRYIALVKLIIDPVVWNVLATSGMAESTVVDDMGARKPHTPRTNVITIFRCGGIRSYIESSTLGTGWVEAEVSFKTLGSGLWVTPSVGEAHATVSSEALEEMWVEGMVAQVGGMDMVVTYYW
jgi:hypothetical protein